jgi:hypothetical protein
MYTLEAPTYVYLPRKTMKDKTFALSLNKYRNAHYMVLTKVKDEYKRIMYGKIMALPMFGTISLSFTYYSKTKQLSDIDNWCSVNNKLFQDCLSTYGKIEDDNYNYVPTVSYSYGGLDPNKKGKMVIGIWELR